MVRGAGAARGVEDGHWRRREREEREERQRREERDGMMWQPH
jgi:hypothetical protein